jgi:putative transposase
LAQAIEADVASFIATHEQEHLEDGRARLVRHGYLPARAIQTGIGAVEIKQPRVRDRVGKERARLMFLPTVAPKYMRRTKSLDALIPWLYLKGVSSGDFQAALSGLLGADAPNLSGDTDLRLRKVWAAELSGFAKSLSADKRTTLLPSR